MTCRCDSKNPLAMYRNVERLVEAIRQHNVDIVHARSRAPAWSASAARLARKPFVTTFHNAYGATRRSSGPIIPSWPGATA